MNKSVAGNTLDIELLSIPMINQYGKFFAIFLFALLQCVAPLLHAHPASGIDDTVGIHSHDVVELHCWSGETSPCPQAEVEALDWQAVGTALASSKKAAPSPELANSSSLISLSQRRASVQFFIAPLPNISIPRFPHASPPAHAPPHTP